MKFLEKIEPWIAPVFLAGVMLWVLVGCAAAPRDPQPLVVTKTIYVPWTWPAYLKICQSDPSPVPVPAVKTQADVARYIVSLRSNDSAAYAAADDCRDTLAAAVFANQADVK